MKSKLTLSIEPAFIEKAKTRAKALNMSVSQLFEQYLRDEDLEANSIAPSEFLKSIPAKQPIPQSDQLSDDEWLEKNLQL